LPNGQTALHAAHLTEAYTLQDSIEVLDQHQFKLLGRNADMIKIAGKRTTLAELNQRLQNIAGVEDGVFFLQTERLNAIVVSSLSKTEIRDALRPYLDPVFLPRHIYFVQKLPRNETGKITKAALAHLINTLN
jgi:acyl-coenzyme A synthetase/AMP-(fatty) acid ligase